MASEPSVPIHHFDDRPAGSDASMFIQWKGTEICMDFICGVCGVNGHLDTDFAYVVRCPVCNTFYEMGTQVVAKRIAVPDAHQQQYARSLSDIEEDD